MPAADVVTREIPTSDPDVVVRAVAHNARVVSGEAGETIVINPDSQLSVSLVDGAKCTAKLNFAVELPTPEINRIKWTVVPPDQGYRMEVVQVELIGPAGTSEFTGSEHEVNAFLTGVEKALSLYNLFPRVPERHHDGGPVDLPGATE